MVDLEKKKNKTSVPLSFFQAFFPCLPHHPATLLLTVTSAMPCGWQGPDMTCGWDSPRSTPPTHVRYPYAQSPCGGLGEKLLSNTGCLFCGGWGEKDSKAFRTGTLGFKCLFVVLSPMFVFQGCCKKGQQTGWPKTTVVHSLTVLKSRSLKSRCQQGWYLLEVLRGNLLLTSFLTSSCCQICSIFFGVSIHCCNLCLHLHMALFPMSMCVSAFLPLYKHTSHTGLESNLI